MKKIIVKATKTRKFISAGLSLFLAIIGTWAVIELWFVKSIEGKWKITFTVKTSDYRPYLGETHTQMIYFKQ